MVGPMVHSKQWWIALGLSEVLDRRLAKNHTCTFGVWGGGMRTIFGGGLIKPNCAIPCKREVQTRHTETKLGLGTS